MGQAESTPEPRRPSNLRTFVGLGDVAGQMSSIAAALRAIGVDARFHNLSANPLGHGGKAGRTGRLLALRYAPAGSLRSRLWDLLLRIHRIVRRLRAAALFPWALIRYDAFVLAGHETFLGGVDLQILRRLGKPVVVIFTGSDHRPPYLSGIGVRDFPSPRAMAAQTRKIRARVLCAERGASAIIALPTSAQLHRRPIVDFLTIGIPFRPGELSALSASATPMSRDTVRILHSPTEPGPKGTTEVREAVERCRASGLPIEYRELVGRPNAEVLQALEWCDFIVDEVYSDTPMAKFATEAAYFGKPAVVGSYATQHYFSWDRPLPPVQLCLPDQIESAIRRLATEHEYRALLGERARAWVLNEWSPERVAARILRVLRNEIPPEWMVSPSEVTYFNGWGIRESDLRRTLRQFIEAEGPPALGLPHASAVLTSVLAFIRPEAAHEGGAAELSKAQ